MSMCARPPEARETEEMSSPAWAKEPHAGALGSWGAASRQTPRHIAAPHVPRRGDAQRAACALAIRCAKQKNRSDFEPVLGCAFRARKCCDGSVSALEAAGGHVCGTRVLLLCASVEDALVSAPLVFVLCNKACGCRSDA